MHVMSMPHEGNGLIKEQNFGWSNFGADGAGMVDQLIWVHDLEVKEGEAFYKQKWPL